MPKTTATSCRDCGSADIEWWVGRYKNPGAAKRRCHPCYLRYLREKYYRQNPGAGPRSERQPVEYQPRPKSLIHCVICGAEAWTHFARSKYCSQRCRNLRPGRNAAVMEYNKSRRAAERESRPVKYPKSPSSPLRFRRCKRCDATMIDRKGRAYCSDACRVAVNIDKVMGLYRVAFETGAVAEACMWRVALTRYLAERDGPKCRICSKVVDLSLSSGPRGDDLGPSIDHVVPRSKGGSDELSNLRLTHWVCNRQRGNRGDMEQLRLVG